MSDDDLSGDLSKITPQYRRALVLVVLLNLTFGAVEVTAGLIARSQALFADSLDFLGDGAISLLALLATGWTRTWRARSALIQGMFLAMLGFGVLGATLYRAIAGSDPAGEIMGIFGGIALVVNVGAAAILLPHRKGDASMRAVWLFSRNDAIGNLAVVVAGGLVAWTGTRWPDIFVACVVAGLFLRSAWTIIGNARNELPLSRAGAE